MIYVQLMNLKMTYFDDNQRHAFDLGESMKIV